MNRPDPRAGFRGRIDSLPEAWKDEPVIGLLDSVTVRFIPGQDGNRVERRESEWFYVNHRNPNVLEHIYRTDFENLEGAVDISAKAWFPDGSTWTLGPEMIHRERSQEGEYPSTNRFVSAFSLPRYPEGALIRLQEVRYYYRPEFLKTELLREDVPCLAKSIRLIAPAKAELKAGLADAEGLPVDTARSVEGDRTVFSAYAERLAKLDARTTPMEPEAWLAAVHFSLPAKGLHARSWTDLGDDYLETQEAARKPTPEMEKLAAGLREADPDTLAVRILALLRARVRYHADTDKLHAYVPRSAGEVLTKGYGDCKEMATLMAALLRLKGVQAGTALVSPPGFFQVLPEYPSLGGFNHMIAYVEVPGRPIRFFDPTVDYGDPNDSYFPVIDRQALVLAKGASRLVKIEAGKGFRNRVETNSSIVQDGKDWRLEGTIRLDGLCAFHLFPMLSAFKGNETAVFLKKYLHEVFGVEASSCKAISHPDRSSITLEYRASFTSNYLDMDKGGLLVNQPTLYGGESRYSTLDFEGPRHFAQVEQADAWKLPDGFGEFKADPLDHDIGHGAWKRKGAILTRTYGCRAADIAAGSRATAAEFYKRKAKFARATLWRE